MQHIASQDALRTSTDRLLEIAGGLDDEALGRLGTDLQSVSQLLDRRAGIAAHAVRGDHAGRRAGRS